MLVPKKMNPPNCPELRPIDPNGKIIKKKLKLSRKTVKSVTDLKKKWDYAAQKLQKSLCQETYGRHQKESQNNL